MKRLPVLLPGLDRIDMQSPDELFELQEAMLVALALIGQPVELQVLTGVETVAKALAKVKDGLTSHNPLTSEALLNATMNLLVQRCLVYRVASKGIELDAHKEWKHRFATHKAIRKYFFHQFKAPNIDYSQVDQLTVSLYSTQPDDLPRPTGEGHRRIRRLIDQLSLFEKAVGEKSHHHSDPFLDSALG